MKPGLAAKRRVLAANDAFYKAMREGDYAAMERLWAERRTVTCTHPDWHMLMGREAVMESWRMILTEHEPPEIWPVDAQAIVTGSTAIVLCGERIGGFELVASNSFVREGRSWRLLNHQAAHAPAEKAR
jgi:hypothetical protein